MALNEARAIICQNIERGINLEFTHPNDIKAVEQEMRSYEK